MFTHIASGKQFENRKEAKKFFGTAYFNKLVKERAFTFHDGREIISDLTVDISQ